MDAVCVCIEQLLDLELHLKFLKEAARKMSRTPPNGETANFMRRHRRRPALFCEPELASFTTTSEAGAGGMGSAAGGHVRGRRGWRD
jgi:hypothetical protein